MSVDELIRELQNEWGQVYIRYYGPDYYDGEQCCVRNVTDEGLPVKCEEIEVKSETLSKALEKAYDEYVK